MPDHVHPLIEGDPRYDWILRNAGMNAAERNSRRLRGPGQEEFAAEWSARRQPLIAIVA